MKNIIYLSYIRRSKLKSFNLSLLTLLFLFTACEDLLVEEPKTIAVEVFYNTPEEVESAVNAIYNQWRSTSYIVYHGFLDIHTDYGYGRGSYAQVNDFQGLNATNITRVEGFWSTFYTSIRNANLVIRNAPEGNAISQADIDKYVAEAKFLRALAYFHLVRNWGEVPLRTEDNMFDRNLEKSSVDEVYNLIIADLQEAEINLLDEPTHIGRPSKWAAKTALADVYLTRGMYADARDKADEVIQSDKYALVSVETRDDFQKIFGPEVVTTSEEIFSLKFARRAGQGNYLLWILNHPSTGLYNFGGAYAHYGDSADPFYTNWDDEDLRKELWDIVNFGLGSTTMVTRKFSDKQAASGHNAGNDLPIYRYAEVLLIYAEAATRAAGSPTQEAMEALNKVHRRAYGYDPNSPSPVDYNISDYNTDTFIDLVLEERAFEFIFEGKRWFDLKRTGTAQEVLLENRGVNIAEKHFLWPIPEVELTNNAALDPSDQNPGY